MLVRNSTNSLTFLLGGFTKMTSQKQSYTNEKYQKKNQQQGSWIHIGNYRYLHAETRCRTAITVEHQGTKVAEMKSLAIFML